MRSQVMGMTPISLRTVAEWTKGRLLYASGDEVIAGVSTDSRKIESGVLFVALKGERFDGHDFVAEAHQKGAIAALVARPLPLAIPQVVVADPLRALGDLAAHYLRSLRESADLRTVAVTGSSGKTSTKEMIAHIASASLLTIASPESFNNEVGVPLTILQAEKHHQVLVLEYAMRKKGDIASLCRIAPCDIAVITNIGTAHIGLLGSRQAIAEAKAEILGQWGLKGEKDYAEVAVLPADDDFAEFLCLRAKGEVVTFGFSEHAHVRGLRCEVTWEGTMVEVTDGTQTVTVKLPVWGKHNARNALAALTVAKVLGISWDIASKALAHFKPPKMRLQRQWMEPPGCWVINDSYNANPDSVKAALCVLHALPAPRKVAVLGEMLELGEFHQQGHFEVGQVAAETVDFLIVVGEGAFAIAEGAEKAGLPPDRIVRFKRVEEAKGAWRRYLRPNDLVLLKASRAIGLERLLEDSLDAPSARSHQP
ncbi:MAG: UDP-N-acetylmuramoyl-tripeptide--D-alanyl-D-alanine ligase [Candidatus Fervidibacterota bacterium]